MLRRGNQPIITYRGDHSVWSTGLFLLLHFIGFGLLMTSLIAGSLLEYKFRRASDNAAKGLILRLLRPIGLLSPVGTLIMLGSGIGNMTVRSLGVFSYGWLTAKIIFFALLVTSGALFAVQSGKRSKLLSQESAPEGKPGNIREANRQVSLFYCVISLLLLVIVCLSIWKP